jgi:diguanylate cyclase (GGDEF)-like protein
MVEAGKLPTVVFVSPSGARRMAFQIAAGERFSRLSLAEGPEQAAALPASDVLLIDLERFERGLDLASLGALVSLRQHGRVLLACPAMQAGWIPALSRFGALDYALTPLDDRELGARAASPQQQADFDDAGRLRGLLALRSRMQQALAGLDDPQRLAEQVCEVLAGYPGVVHAALFELARGGNLCLAAQAGYASLDAAALLGRAEGLVHSPYRLSFPGLSAACTGELALLDDPAKCGEPELAGRLASQGVCMAAAAPIQARAGLLRGSICLMFDRHRTLLPEEFDTIAALAQQAGVALAMSDMARDADALAGRLTQLAQTDALTGASNRRHGEDVLLRESRRAERYGHPLAYIALDLDRFRKINELFGHACGDLALRHVADLARTALRGSDTLVRSGGGEFAIIAPHTDAIDGLKVAEKLRAAIEDATFPGCDRVTVSIGVGQLSGNEGADRLTVRVGNAVARAKRAGRNCVELAMA